MVIKNFSVESGNTDLDDGIIKASGEAAVVKKSVIGTLFLFNLPLALTLIKLLQFFEFFSLFNLQYPKNLLQFFELFRGGIFSFLPNIFENVGKNDSKVG
jgi:hypothetical protein